MSIHPGIDSDILSRWLWFPLTPALFTRPCVAASQCPRSVLFRRELANAELVFVRVELATTQYPALQVLIDHNVRTQVRTHYAMQPKSYI
jgi:hypothetical protein